MARNRPTNRTTIGALALLLFAAGGPATAQQAPEDLTAVPPVTSDYAPPLTAWGDPDFRGTWPTDHVAEAKVPLVRPDEFGERAWLTEEEYAARLAKARESDGAYSADLSDNGTAGLAEWLERAELGRRSSLLVDPRDGKLPALLPEAEALHQAGRASWVDGQALDWIDDLDIWDRCVSPGFPAAMMPFPYNNGIRIFQSPGQVVIYHEMLGARIVPLDDAPHLPEAVRSWQGDSRGHWEGATLVIETENMFPGDAATREVASRAASPVYYEDPHPVPTGPHAKAVERLTMTGPDRIVYELTYSDPDVFTAPWTVRFDWLRDESYQFYEFACHEGNTQLRHMINSSRAQRKADAETAAGGD